MNQRDTYRYKLKEGNRILYIGITNDTARRKAEHQRDKEFGHMFIEGPAVTRQTAEQWEAEELATYRRSHGGQNPPYNKTSNGR